MPSYKLRNAARGSADGASEEMKFCNYLHRGVEETMLGVRLVLKDSFISGKPKFPASEREVDSPRDLMG